MDHSYSQPGLHEEIACCRGPYIVLHTSAVSASRLICSAGSGGYAQVAITTLYGLGGTQCVPLVESGDWVGQTRFFFFR